MQPVLHAPRTRKRSLAAAVLGAVALIGSLLVATPPAQALNDTGTGGVFVPASGRILDTKLGTGGFSTPMEAGKYRTIKVAGLAGLPDDGSVGAVSLNATVGGSAGAGTLFGRPDANFSRTTMLIYSGVSGEYTSNSATIAVGADGTIQVMTENATRLILDVQGYYTANTDGPAAGGFVPVAKRIVDTRSGLGATKATIAPGKSVDVQITGSNGIPFGASGVVVNLLPINSTDSDGYLTPYAAGGPKPQNPLHYAPSVTTSIQAQVPLSSDGKITIANSSSTVNLVIDLQGYFTAAGTSGAIFTPSYGRAYDSRAAGNTALAKSETRSIQIAGKGGVPVMGSGITAVTLTLIVSHAGSTGYAQAYADRATNPGTTAINFQADDIRSNTITVPLGDNGKISLRNVADTTNYIVDVQGWYADPAAPTISCPTEYSSGTWVNTLPAAAIMCTVTAAPAVDSDTILVATVDGDPLEPVAVSTAAATSVSVSIPTRVGWHEIDAAVATGSDDLNTQSFTLGLNDGQPSSVLAAIQAASPESFSDVTAGTTTASGAVAVNSTGDVDVTVPTNPTGTIDLITKDPSGADADTLQAALPFAGAASNARVEAGGIVSYDNGNGSFTVPVVHSDGTVQINTVLTSGSAPSSFTYPLTPPAGATVSLVSDGSVVITDSSGAVIGHIDVPWARDAHGAAVPTQFTLSGNTLTQTVDLSSSGIAFPVVADPGVVATAKAVAGCLLEIAPLIFAGAEVVKAFAKAVKLIKASKTLLKAYAKVGGTMKSLIKLVKKYVKDRSSMTKAQINALGTFVSATGHLIWDTIGFPTCYDLIRGDF